MNPPTLHASTPSAKRAAPMLRPGQIFDPVARALDLVGDRWKLVLVRHLLVEARGFQELRRRTGIAPRVLSQRLRQLIDEGLVRQVPAGGRQHYTATERGRSLEPIIAAAARWWVHHAMEEAGAFRDTSAQSILESLPFLLREDRAIGAEITFEVRLRGEGGGVWTIRIDRGVCTVRKGFADHADVRYSASAKVWCAVAVGVLDAGAAYRDGRLSKEGTRAALDDYFYQLPQERSVSASQ